jgi:3-oxoacyl-[acyl-carrier protein] reductase
VKDESEELRRTIMDLGLKDKVAFITGASRGIGKGIAVSLAREGCKVALTATRADLLAAVSQEIEVSFGVEVAWWTGDLLKSEDATRVVDAAAAHFGRIDIVVNNAGAAPGGVLEALSDEAWELGIGLKFMGYVRVTRAVIPYMQKQQSGRVVNLIGNDGVKHSYWEIVPGAANAAGQNFTIALAGQYGKDNISFCAVNPGPVRTERWSGLVQAMARDMNLSFEQADQLAPASIPLGRIAEVEEVADLVTYLASPKAHFVNGTMIEIDGGQMKPMMDAMRNKV